MLQELKIDRGEFISADNRELYGKTIKIVPIEGIKYNRFMVIAVHCPFFDRDFLFATSGQATKLVSQDMDCLMTLTAIDFQDQPVIKVDATQYYLDKLVTGEPERVREAFMAYPKPFKLEQKFIDFSDYLGETHGNGCNTLPNQKRSL